jgi:hypothetical protein
MGFTSPGGGNFKSRVVHEVLKLQLVVVEVAEYGCWDGRELQSDLQWSVRSAGLGIHTPKFQRPLASSTQIKLL